MVVVVPPPGDELVKEEDKLVDFGDAFATAPVAVLLPGGAMVLIGPDQAGSGLRQRSDRKRLRKSVVTVRAKGCGRRWHDDRVNPHAHAAPISHLHVG